MGLFQVADTREHWMTDRQRPIAGCRDSWQELSLQQKKSGLRDDMFSWATQADDSTRLSL
jgi:hypothetical protein